VSDDDVAFAERFACLRLPRTESVGPVAFQHLVGRYGTAAKALAALPELARRAGRAPAIYTPEQAYAEITEGEMMGATLFCVAEPGFPEALRALDPPPPVIWALGDAALLQRRAVAIVGARVASAAGCRFARAWPASWARRGWRSFPASPAASMRPRGLAAHRYGRSPGRGHRRCLSAGERRPLSPDRRRRLHRLRERAQAKGAGQGLPPPQPADLGPVASGGGGRGRAEV